MTSGAGFRSSSPFPTAAAGALRNGQLRDNLARATATIRHRREMAIGALADFEALRESAAAIEDLALSRLDALLRELEVAVVAAGGTVHFAADAASARSIVTDLVKATGARSAVKVKSMTTAEIELNAALEDVGIEVKETDLAELIVQLGDDLPSHIVVPAIHRNRAEIRATFLAQMGKSGVSAPASMTDDPSELAGAARVHLREHFLRARVAISGANFAVAETGSLVVVESEGNGRMCLSLPETLISVVGIDKVIPTFRDLEVFLQLLAASATGESMNPYTSIWTGVTPGDGPQDFHLVLLDNGRSAALRDRTGRQALRCIRCAACLNVCPVYERVGGHAYGSVYPGPIGAVLTPQLDHVANDPVVAALPFASTLCGACYEVCPVGIDIPRLLVHLRSQVVDAARAKGATPESIAMGAAAWVFRDAGRLALVERVAGVAAGRRIRRLPGVLARWTDARDAPAPAKESFRSWWSTRHPEEPTRAQLRLHFAGLLAAMRSRRDVSRPWRAVVAPAAPGTPVREGGAGTDREIVLGRVRAALEASPYEPIVVPRSYLGARATSDTSAQRYESFARRVRDYGATIELVGPDTVAASVQAVLTRRGAARVVVPADTPQAWLAALREDVRGPEILVDHGELDARSLDVDGTSVLTGAACAIAATGTIVLDAGSAQGRRLLSLVPDHHLVVLDAQQIVTGVPDAMSVLRHGGLQTWISGPSATSDIELQRVEGVHGPRLLDILVVGPESPVPATDDPRRDAGRLPGDPP